MRVPTEHSYVRSLGAVLRNRLVVAAILLSVIDPISLGAIDLLVPRHLHGHGVPTWHIGAALMLGAALGAVAGPLAGRRADCVGALRVGLVAATVLVMLPAALILGLSDPLQLVLLVVLAPAFTILSTAMYPLSTSGADARGVSHGVVNGVISVTWATAFADRLAALGRARRPPRRHASPTSSSRASARRCWRRSRSSRAARSRRPRDVRRPPWATAPSDPGHGSSTPSTLSAASAVNPRRASSPSR